LLGDPDLDDVPLTKQPQNLVQTADSLADLAIFCGFANMHIDDVPHDSTLEFSLYPANPNPDDSPDDAPAVQMVPTAGGEQPFEANKNAVAIEDQSGEGSIDNGSVTDASSLTAAVPGVESTKKKEEPQKKKNAIQEDDSWFTKSFFIALTPERLDLLHKVTSKNYDPVLGLAPEGPLSTFDLLKLQGKVDFDDSLIPEDVEVPDCLS
jgi:hypothetical protein